MTSVPRQYWWVTSSGASSAAMSTGAVIIQARRPRVRREAREPAYGSTVVASSPSRRVPSPWLPGAAADGIVGMPTRLCPSPSAATRCGTSSSCVAAVLC